MAIETLEKTFQIRTNPKRAANIVITGNENI